MITTTRRLALAMLASLAGSGCSTYLDARHQINGPQQAVLAGAGATLQEEVEERKRLRKEEERRRKELEAQTRRIATLEADLQRNDESLATALAAGKLTRTRHAQLRRELTAVQAQTQQLADPARTAPATLADAAGQARLAGLEARKAALEAELARLASR